MTVLQSVGNDFRYRSKLKKDLLIISEDLILYFSNEKSLPEIVSDSTLLASEISFRDKHGCLIKAAEYF